MSDLVEDLRDWYADLDTARDSVPLVESAVHCGTSLRRRRRGLAAMASIVCVALVATVVATSRDSSPKSHVDVVATAPSAVATERVFPDLGTLVAWLAPTVAKSAAAPASVRVQIVHSTLGAFFEAIEGRTVNDSTRVYVVEVTGSSFDCPCGRPDRVVGSALLVAWNPAIHYAAMVTARAPIKMGALGHAYPLSIAHPQGRAPTGPVCGQKRGRVRTITATVHLDHTVQTGAGIFIPPGSVRPRLGAAAALHAVDATSPYELAPRVKASLAESYLLAGGHRLVWILSVPSVEILPSFGLPQCGPVAAVVDATTGAEIEGLEGPRF